MGVAFEHAFEIDQVFLGFFFIFILLFFLLHEAEHFVFRVLLEVFFLEVHDGFLLIQRTRCGYLVFLAHQNAQDAESGLSDVLPFHLVDRRCAAGPSVSVLRIFEQEEEGGTCAEVQHEGVCFENIDGALRLTPVLDSSVGKSRLP